MSNSTWVKKFGRLIVARHGDYRFHPREYHIVWYSRRKVFTIGGFKFSLEGFYPRKLKDWLHISKDKFFSDWGYLVVSLNLFGYVYYVRWLHGTKCKLTWIEEKLWERNDRREDDERR